MVKTPFMAYGHTSLNRNHYNGFKGSKGSFLIRIFFLIQRLDCLFTIDFARRQPLAPTTQLSAALMLKESTSTFTCWLAPRLIWSGYDFVLLALPNKPLLFAGGPRVVGILFHPRKKTVYSSGVNSTFGLFSAFQADKGVHSLTNSTAGPSSPVKESANMKEASPWVGFSRYSKSITLTWQITDLRPGSVLAKTVQPLL